MATYVFQWPQKCPGRIWIRPNPYLINCPPPKKKIGSVSQDYGIGDPDPKETFADPQHWILLCSTSCKIMWCSVVNRRLNAHEKTTDSASQKVETAATLTNIYGTVKVSGSFSKYKD